MSNIMELVEKYEALRKSAHERLEEALVKHLSLSTSSYRIDIMYIGSKYVYKGETDKLIDIKE